MQKRVTFRHMEHTPVLDSYIHEQLAKLVDYLTENEREPIYLDFVLEPHDLHAHHKAELNLKTPRFDIFVHKFGPDAYQVISNVIDEAYKKVLSEKEKYVDDNKRGMQHAGEVPELLEKQMHDDEDIFDDDEDEFED